jgi:ferrochelatase
MQADGVNQAACFVTSAYSSWSSCRQYRENLYDAAESVDRPPHLDKLRHYFNHPGFVEPVADGVLAALADLPAGVRHDAHLAFVTHSIPAAMNDTSGPDGGAYVAQHLDVSALVAARVAEESGTVHPHQLVYCSRSGAPHVPWLEPDVNDHLEALARHGVPAVVLVPVGFVSDHMEVVYDLDTEARATAERLGIDLRRSATAGTDRRFAAMVRDLLLERAAVERSEPVVRASEGEIGPLWDRCPVGCCPNPRADRPALCGQAQASSA